MFPLKLPLLYFLYFLFVLSSSFSFLASYSQSIDVDNDGWISMQELIPIVFHDVLADATKLQVITAYAEADMLRKAAIYFQRNWDGT